MKYILRDYQNKAIALVKEKLREGKRRIIIGLATGSGKCLGKDTPVVMADGSLKMVQDIIVGDKLLGPDGKVRNVLSLASGFDDLYKITPTKGDPYVTNSCHLLSLLPTGDKQFYLSDGVKIDGKSKNAVFVESKCLYNSNRTAQHCLKAWFPDKPMEFDNAQTELTIPPYILGIWLGDGHCSSPAISKPDGPITEAFCNYVASLGLRIRECRAEGKCPTFVASSGRSNKNKNHLLTKLRDLNVFENKHIPKSYLFASVKDRLQLLAGLLDTDGHFSKSACEITQKSKQLSDDITFLARSLGFYVAHSYEEKGIKSIGFSDFYHRLYISGDMTIIPCIQKTPVARNTKLRHNVTGIKIERSGVGEYFGFEIDGDRQFLLGDWQVTHNTSTACGIIEMALAKGSKVAFVCNRIQLIQQSYETFFNQGFHDIGMIQGENTQNVNAKLLVCSIQSIAKRGLPEDIKVIIEDECHAVAGSSSYWPIMEDRVVIGLTATPQQKGLGRHNERLGGPLFEELVSGITMKELTEQGFLVPMVAYGPNEVADLSKVRTVAGEYREDDLDKAMNKPALIGDVVRQWFKHAKDKQTMVFATSISHSKHICEEFILNGVNAVHVDFSMPTDEKTKIYKDFKENRIMVLCNCALLSEGSDFPAAECLSYAKPTKSSVRYMQVIGRVLRPSHGKSQAIVLDHGGNVARFGFPDDINVDKLDDGKPKKSDSERKEKEKEEPKPKECPQCKYLMRVGMKVCVGCGWHSKPKSDQMHTDDDLVEITKNGKKKPLNKTQMIASNPEQQILAQLKHRANIMGYKEGWVSYTYRDIFGHFPGGEDRSVSPMEPSAELLSWLRSQQIKKAKARSNGRW